MKSRALVTGATGQDASYLMELLLEKGYEVHATVRRSSLEPDNLARVKHILKDIVLHEADLLDQSSLSRVMQAVKPQEVYHLAAQSHVGVSFKEPEHTANVTGLGTLRMLEACRTLDPMPRFYQAGSSEQFGNVAETPQTEKTELRARSPYGAAKIFAHHMVKVYREGYGMHASVGILFNHGSPRRGLNFVTRKITRHIAKQALGLTTEPLELGNLDSRRDWGFAGDYVRAMWLMLQQPKPSDYVIATGETHSVREFVEATYENGYRMGIQWKGRGLTEIGRAQPHTCWCDKDADAVKDRILVRVNSKFYRPADVETLTGDPVKALRVLEWRPGVSFLDLAKMMVKADLEDLKP